MKTHSDSPASPCITICRINEKTRICEGCFRTLDEIATWMRMSDEAKRAVLAELPARRAGKVET